MIEESGIKKKLKNGHDSLLSFVNFFTSSRIIFFSAFLLSSVKTCMFLKPFRNSLLFLYFNLKIFRLALLIDQY